MLTSSLRLVYALLVALGSTFGLSGCRPTWNTAVERFRERLVRARDGLGTERLVEGKVKKSGESLRAPSSNTEVVAFATWKQVRRSVYTYDGRPSLSTAEDFRVENVSFEVETDDGLFPVSGQVVGFSDLVRRNRGAEGDVEISIGEGDRVCVLGVLSERNDQRGFYDDVIVVKGTFKEFYDVVEWEPLPSIPIRPPE